MQSVKGLVVSALVIVVSVGGMWAVFQSWEQTCLGIFEDRDICESKREYRRDFRVCARQSWNRCGPLRSKTEPEPYDACLEKIRCSCMRSRSHDTCDYF